MPKQEIKTHQVCSAEVSDVYEAAVRNVKPPFIEENDPHLIGLMAVASHARATAHDDISDAVKDKDSDLARKTALLDKMAEQLQKIRDNGNGVQSVGQSVDIDCLLVAHQLETGKAYEAEMKGKVDPQEAA